MNCCFDQLNPYQKIMQITIFMVPDLKNNKNITKYQKNIRDTRQAIFYYKNVIFLLENAIFEHAIIFGLNNFIESTFQAKKR